MLQASGQEAAAGRGDAVRLAAVCLHRSNSVGSEGRKRKDRASSGAGEVDPIRRKINSTAYVIMESLEAVSYHFQQIEKVVKENKHNYRDIKDAVARLSKTMEVLRRDSTKNWLDSNKWEKVETPTYDADCQTDRMRRGVDGSTQTERRPVERGAKIEESEELMKEASVTKARVVWTTTEEMKSRTGGKVLEVGSAVSLSRKTGIELDGEAVENVVTTTWYLVAAGKDGGEGDEEVREACIKELASKLQRQDIKEVAMVRDRVWESLKGSLRKMGFLEGFTFTAFRDRKATWSQVAAGTQAAKGSEAKESAPRKEAFIVKAGEGGYSAALKRVKEDLAGAGVDVSVIRQTRAGDVLVEAKGVPGKAGLLREALAKQEVRIAGGRTPVVIRGLDALVTKEDILEAIKKTLGEGNPAEFAEMWTTYGDTRAARIHTSREAAAKLMKEDKIQVGPLRCRVQTSEKSRCYRCWEDGHRAASCKGPDRRNRCFRCGEEGHTAAVCQNEERCLSCLMRGHRTGASNCRGAREQEGEAASKGTAPNSHFRAPPGPNAKK